MEKDGGGLKERVAYWCSKRIDQIAEGKSIYFGKWMPN